MNKKIDYSKLEEITVKSQKELDDIPLDFEGRIYIEFGKRWDPAIVKNKYYYRVIVRGNSSAELWENSSAELRGNSSAVLRENSSAELWENSSAVLRGNSSAVLWENSSAELWENSSAELRGNSSAELWGNSSAELWENSSAELRGNSSAVLRENSSAELWENSSAELWENSSAELRENSSADATGNTQILDRQTKGKINISGKARIVYMPKNINDFIDFYGIKHTKTTAIFYKAVRKDKDGIYYSDYYNDFTYEIGKYKTERCDPDVEENCSYGINISHLNWALNFGSCWSNLAILEVKTKISDIVMPINTDGKVRTSKVKVLREVPLEECGIYGKILAKRRQAND